MLLAEFKLKATTADQTYCDDIDCENHQDRLYDGFNAVYRKKVDDACAAVNSICMVIRSSQALFCSYYCADYNAYLSSGISGSALFQNGVVILASQGRTWNSILAGYYDYGTYPGYSGIQRIDFVACYK